MYKLNAPLILASGSPRRKQMLEEAGIIFNIIVSNEPEEVLENELPEEMVLRLAKLKGQSVAKNNTDSWVLSADTTVVIDNEILNKPLDNKDSFRMLSKLQGRTHQVWGGVCIWNQSRQTGDLFSICSNVYMRELSNKEIESYIDTGECLDKAGSYAIQGIGASLIEKVEGSYTNVVGLDLAQVICSLKKLKVID
jgi:septum formation protein